MYATVKAIIATFIFILNSCFATNAKMEKNYWNKK